MQITTFNPAIVTKDAQSVIELFEALGFERRHTKTGINDSDITNVRMRYTNEDGKIFHVDIASAPVPRDITAIRMNVRDFEEAYNMLEEKGFKNAQGEKVTHTSSSVATMMVSPSGFAINLGEHIREHE
jgi:adenylate cyclase class IV